MVLEQLVRHLAPIRFETPLVEMVEVRVSLRERLQDNHVQLVHLRVVSPLSFSPLCGLERHIILS